MDMPQVGDVWEYGNERQIVKDVANGRVSYTTRRTGGAVFDLSIGLFRLGATLVERDGKAVGNE